ncbi:T9SS type A sorting domain-containing protein [uncultured Psychroserpens sp.]|uniref:T9SS type A sorting domain-containing protein n=1 Tax=uncultured Psychroserpens sp. TaxID=255436 RepID=UPI00261ECBA5|nr:T9SS type A sorting domain-containing protein [uncultured Psychroserpens sp.]
MKTFTYFCLAMLLCLLPESMHAMSTNNSPTVNSQVQRVRIDITTPLGYTRHLLLGFTPDNAATDGFDYGYDAQNIDNYSNDCNWIIDHNRYVIQGVGAFHESKTYPLGLFLSNAGDVEFSLLGLENFEHSIDVYIYDAQDGSVTSISNNSLVEAMSYGEHLNRFYITFTNDVNAMAFANGQLSVNDFDKDKTEINYISSTKELKIKTANSLDVQDIRLYSILGKKVKHWKNLKPNSSGILKVPVSNISKGTYIVRVTTKAGISNKRLIISN